MRAGQNAIDHKYITHADIKYTVCNGQTESEFEDCLNPNIYSQKIKDDFGVDIHSSSYFKGDKKWSDRLKKTFLSQGQPWTDNIEKKVKLAVANSIPDNPDEALIPQKRVFNRCFEKCIRGLHSEQDLMKIRCCFLNLEELILKS
ncbi:MAG: hypothetical protein LBM93_04890 [Oscillospiraceae bacterium]|nr:hypothetical protein [Oscillospiraceae bacterium]